MGRQESRNERRAKIRHNSFTNRRGPYAKVTVTTNRELLLLLVYVPTPLNPQMYTQGTLYGFTGLGDH